MSERCRQLMWDEAVGDRQGSSGTTFAFVERPRGGHVISLRNRARNAPEGQPPQGELLQSLLGGIAPCKAAVKNDLLRTYSL